MKTTPIREQIYEFIELYVDTPEPKKLCSSIEDLVEELAESKVKNLALSGVSQCFAIKEPIIIDAMKACLSVGYASTSLFTRRLNVPYKTAMKIMDTLEDNKMVGMFNGTTKRDLILNDAEFKKLLKQNCG